MVCCWQCLWKGVLKEGNCVCDVWKKKTWKKKSKRWKKKEKLCVPNLVLCMCVWCLFKGKTDRRTRRETCIEGTVLCMGRRRRKRGGQTQTYLGDLTCSLPAYLPLWRRTWDWRRTGRTGGLGGKGTYGYYYYYCVTDLQVAAAVNSAVASVCVCLPIIIPCVDRRREGRRKKSLRRRKEEPTICSVCGKRKRKEAGGGTRPCTWGMQEDLTLLFKRKLTGWDWKRKESWRRRHCEGKRSLEELDRPAVAWWWWHERRKDSVCALLAPAVRQTVLLVYFNATPFFSVWWFGRKEEERQTRQTILKLWRKEGGLEQTGEGRNWADRWPVTPDLTLD